MIFKAELNQTTRPNENVCSTIRSLWIIGDMAGTKSFTWLITFWYIHHVQISDARESTLLRKTHFFSNENTILPFVYLNLICSATVNSSIFEREKKNAIRFRRVTSTSCATFDSLTIFNINMMIIQFIPISCLKRKQRKRIGLRKTYVTIKITRMWDQWIIFIDSTEVFRSEKWIYSQD